MNNNLIEPEGGPEDFYLHRLFIKAYSRTAIDYYASLERYPDKQILNDFVIKKSGTETGFLMLQEIFKQLNPIRESVKKPFITRVLYRSEIPYFTGINFSWTKGETFEFNMINVSEEKVKTILQSAFYRKELEILSTETYCFEDTIKHRPEFEISVNQSVKYLKK